ncbi:MAG: EAL domain-containing protein [Thermoanaerobaculia bacterium]
MQSLRFWRSRVAATTGTDDDRDVKDLVDFLVGQMTSPRSAEVARLRVAAFRRLPISRRREELPSLYLLLEQYLVQADPSHRFDQAQLRELVASRFPDLLEIPRFGIIFQDRPAQELDLARRFLVNVLERAADLLGSRGGALEGLSQWVSSIPEVSVPCELLPDRAIPGTPRGWTMLLADLSAALHTRLAHLTGEELADRTFEASYDALASSYVNLDGFPAIIRLLPDHLLDGAKLALLNRAQIESAFLDKLDELQAGNEELFVLNEQLSRARAELEGMKDDLEKRVADRTADLQRVVSDLQHEVMQRIEAETALKESEQRYALAAAGANDGLWDWNLVTGELYFSPRWKAMIGYSDEELGSTPEVWFERIHPEDVQRVQARISAHLQSESPHFESEYRLRQKEGGYRFMLCRGLAVLNERGIPVRMAGSQTDITEAKVAEDQLMHEVYHDPLTTLPNRPLFLDRLAVAITRARRHKIGFAVLFLDLDRFKVINDSLGHDTGDRLLKQVSQRVASLVREGDTLARFGGDEFTILLEDLHSQTEALQIAERVQEVLRMPFHDEDRQYSITASIGIAPGGPEYEKPEDVIRDADTAMYRAKSLGKARSVVFEKTMHASAVQLLELETELRRAVDRDEFRLNYQPIVDLATSHIVGFEALIRWVHPTRGIVMPDEFIPLAEETGLIARIGRWVFREACRTLHEWEHRFHPDPPLTMSLNLSAMQLTAPDLAAELGEQLGQCDVDPGSLHLEITESAIMRDPDGAARVLVSLRDLGLKITIDDFGTGYSSLSYLHRFRVDGLKIDRSFVGSMIANPESAEIVRTVIALAHAMNLEVIAEGIETEQQLAMLKMMKCEYGQGFLFARPAPGEIFEEQLKAG